MAKEDESALLCMAEVGRSSQKTGLCRQLWQVPLILEEAGADGSGQGGFVG